MWSPGGTDRLALLGIGLLLFLAPVLILGLTLASLVLMGDLVLGRVTPVEFLELYVLDLVLFVAFAYGLYRLTLLLVVEKLPESLDTLDRNGGDANAADSGDGESAVPGASEERD